MILPLAIAILATREARLAEAAPAPPPAPHVSDGSASPADAILGLWTPAESDVVVELARRPVGYEGVVLRSSTAAQVGKVMLRGLTYDPAHGTWSGEVFAPKRGEFVPATFRVQGSDHLLMTAGQGSLTKDVTWARAR